MPEITSCPECEKKLRVPDDLLGKKVRCPGCSVMFIAQAGAGLSEETPKAAARAPAPRNEAFSERRSGAASAREEDEEARPRARRRQEEEDTEEDRPRPRRRYVEDEEDTEEDTPRSRRNGSAGDQRIRTRPDDDDDRPRRSRRDEEDEDHPYRSRDEEEEDDSRDRKRNAAKGWRGVRLGLTLVMIAGWVALGMVGIGSIAMGVFLLMGVSLFSAVASAAPNQQVGTAASGAVAMGMGMILFFLVIGLMVLAELILRITGYGLCMQVPTSRRNSARGLAIAAFSCAAAAMVLNLTGAGMNGMGGFGRGGMALAMAGSGNILGNVAGLVALAGFICWLIFMRSVALELRGPAVAQRIIQYIITTLVFGAVAFLLVIIVAVVVGVSAASGGGLGVLGALGVFAFFLFGLLGLAGLGLYVWYLLIVMQVRGLVDRHLARM